MKGIPLIRLIDRYFIGFLCILSGAFRLNRKPPAEPRKILIIRLWTLGETILVLPMAKALRERYPKAEISVLCTSRNYEVISGLNFIDKKIIFDIKNPAAMFKLFHKFDLAIDTEPYLRISALLSAMLSKFSVGFRSFGRGEAYNYSIIYNDRQHVVQTFCDLLKPLGINAKPTKLIPLPFTSKDEIRVDAILKNHGIYNKKLVGIHTGTAETSPWRAWPKENFRALSLGIASEKNTAVVIIGKGNSGIAKPESGIFELSNLSLGELACLMKKLSVFVSSDTGPMHLAAAQGVHTIGLFGPNLPERFGPFPPEKNTIIYDAMPCSPCINTHKGQFKECKENGKCMRSIPPGKVINIVKKFL